MCRSSAYSLLLLLLLLLLLPLLSGEAAGKYCHVNSGQGRDRRTGRF
jgi:hypothetical protein